MDYIYGKLSNVANINEFIERIEECEYKVDECEQQVDTMTYRFNEAMTQFGELDAEVKSYSGRLTQAEEDSTYAKNKADEAYGIASSYEQLINQLSANKEDKANKVTAWSGTPDNTNYPSEKLVKDSLDNLNTNLTHSIGEEETARRNADDLLTPKTRKVGGVSLENDTDNLQGYTYDTNQTLKQKIDAMDNAIGGKQTQLTQPQLDAVNSGVTSSKVTSYDSHIINKENPHEVTKAQVGLGNVDNKSSETIRSEITSQNIVDALGYTPGTSNFSGNYSDLSGKPTDLGDFTNNAGYITAEGVVYSINRIEADNEGNVQLKVSDLTNDEGFVSGSIDTTNKTITIDNTTINYGNTGANNLVQLDGEGKLALSVMPSTVLGQMIYGGTFNAMTQVATLTSNAKALLGVTADTITLTNDTTEPGGYVINEGIYYIVNVGGSFADILYNSKDWVISTGSGWSKVDNTEQVESVNGHTGVVVITKNDVDLGNVENKSSATIRSEITSTNVTDALGYTPGTSNFSGDYNDLTNKPTIPVVPSDITQSISVNGSTYTPDANGNVDLGNIGGGGGSYTAGTGIDITNNVISVDSSLLANCIGYEEVVE